MVQRVREVTAVVFILTVGFCGGVPETVTVRVKQGVLEGIQKTNRLTQQPYYAFLGIPYARPPVGDRRFKDPEDPLPWSGILNATQERNACLSLTPIFKLIKGNEDCLHLNVLTLKKPQDIKSPCPVMVWIHGGAFMTGSGTLSHFGPDFLMRKDIVLVTINYRLNVFGFLSLQNNDVPGNAGLKDQVMALKWVKNNIAAFGGDPNRVTIFGQSAGAASVHYLMLSPSAKGLFHRAISQSGVALSSWALTKNVRNTAFKLGEVFDCNIQNDTELLTCLQDVDAKDLLTYQFKIIANKNTKFLTENINLPCLEPRNTKNPFLTERPLQIMQAGNFNDVPFMLGVLKLETLMFMTNDILLRLIFPSMHSITQLNGKPELLLPRTVLFWNSKFAKEAAKEMKKFYFQNQTISKDTFDNLVNATSDSWFVFAVHKTAMLHSESGKSPVYLYNFILDREFGESDKIITPPKRGPSHADDLKYLYYLWRRDIEISQDDLEIISKINNLWINFATYGNPTPDKNASEVIWEPFKPEKRAYLEIGDEFTMKTDLGKERMEFWQNLTEKGRITMY